MITAFVVNPQLSSISTKINYPALHAKKIRKRKRKNPLDEPTDGIEQQIESSDVEVDDLPDFDLDEEEELESSRSEIETMSQSVSMTDISPEMMASSSPSRSYTSDRVIPDRSLESTFEFDAVETRLPLGPEIAGKKRKKIDKKARKEAAILASKMEEEESSSSLLDPLWKTEDGEPFTAVQLLERGTWFCMGTLVLWEIYINSPFFERAAPSIPVVFQ